MESIQWGGKIICTAGFLLMTTKHTLPREREWQLWLQKAGKDTSLCIGLSGSKD